MARDGHFLTPDGTRVRFWGCNLAAEAAFPPVEEIPALARRLAKGGVNIARLHHLDNEWAANRGGSLWPAGHANHEHIDPGQLDRLFRLVAALKAEGIYSNVNLKVSRSLVPADGFPNTVQQLPVFQKRVDIFDRRMIELQKAYARQLLTTKNPHTGLTLAEDPAVAVIEMNNENSLLGFWTRDLGRGLDRLPEPFRSQLTTKWNTWLTRHYANDAAIKAAWTPPATGTDPDRNLIPPGAAWTRKQTGGADFALEPGSDATSLAIDVRKTSGVDWHVQAQLPGVPVRDGEVYSLSMLARADAPRRLGVGVGLDMQKHPDEVWRSFGLLDSVAVGTDWTPVHLTFAAHSVNGDEATLQLNAGDRAGTVTVKDIRFSRGANSVGLQDGQSAGADTVPIPTLASAAQWADWLHFLADTERDYAEEMRRFLKDELGVTAPVIGSQIEYGGLAGMWREQAMDFTDTHAYWQHPVLENGDFDSANWTIDNSPQIAAFGTRSFGELGERAMLRVAARPFAVSEFDHPAPSEYACEMYPTLASFACRQDWDAVYPFDIGVTGSGNPHGTIGRFFDQLHHPAKWGFGPFAARTFRHGLVAPAPVVAELKLSPPPWQPMPHADLYWRSLIREGSLDFLNVRYEISPDYLPEETPAQIERHGSPGPTPVTLMSAPRGQVYVINADAAAGAVGFLGGASVDAGALHVRCEGFGRDFAAVTAVALDEKPLSQSSRVLVTIVGRARNQDITWNQDRTSVGAKWGHGPPIVERVPATLTLAGAVNRTVYALAPDGQRGHRVTTKQEGGRLTFTVGAEDATIDYEIVAEAGR